MKALIIDDEYFFRKMLIENPIWAQFDIEICADAADGAQGLALAKQHQPDLILADINMPVVNGLEFIDAASEMLYTYDTWGDVLSAIDMTDVTHPLTTRYQYDGWGNLIKTIHPTNAVETSSINWGSSTDMKYYIEESGTGKPTVKTWYDSYGRKTLCQYALPCGVQHKETYAYNAKDQVLRKSVSDISVQGECDLQPSH